MIGVVGGGISGLALSHYLRRLSVEHVVLEAATKPGGVMRTERVEGIPLDLGPQRMRMTREIRDVVSDLGLSDQILVAPRDLPLWVYRKGRLRRVPLSPGQALTTDLLSWRGKLRMLLEPLRGGHRDDESVEAFLTRKFGREAYDAFLGPLYGGLYASDPGRMRTGHGLSRTLEELGVEGSVLWAVVRRGFRAREEVATVSFQEGIGTLPRALASAAGGALRLSTPVEALERRGRGWSLRLGGRAEGERLQVARVVLALPAPAAARMLGEADPESAARLASLRYNPLAVVHLQAACPLRGYGFQVAFGEPLETRGVTWNASIFDRDGVYTAYLGGMANPDLVEWEDQRIGELARQEFRAVTGCAGRVLLVSRTRVPAWDETWDALSSLSLPEGVLACASWNARPGIPGRFAQAREIAERIGRP